MAGLKICWILRAGQLIANWIEDEQPITSAIVEKLLMNLPNTQEDTNTNDENL